MTERTGATVLLVAMGPSTPGDGLVAGVQALRQAGHRVHLVCRRAPSTAVEQAVDAVTSLPAPRLLRLGGRPITLGKLRLDPDRLPGAVRLLRSHATRDLVRRADVLVAVDQAAIPAVWLAARRARRRRPSGTVPAAVSGLPAAVARSTPP